MNNIENSTVQWAQALRQTYFSTSLMEWAIALSSFFLIFIGLKFSLRLLSTKLAKMAARTATDWDDFFALLLNRTKLFFIFVIALRVSSSFVFLTHKVETFVQSIFIIGALLQVALWGGEVIRFVLNHFVVKRQGETDAASMKTTVSAIGFILKMFFYSLLFLLILDNLGFNISALIAGLGIGGIAVALAVQNVLSDVFASLSIVFDKPFVLGDYIAVGDDQGTVEKIGLKTTRIRSLTGEQISFSNAELLKSRIRNYKRMDNRRVQFQLALALDPELSVDTLSQVSTILSEIVKSQPQTRLERAHLKSIGDFKFLYEVAYFVLVSDYNVYVEIEQNINLEIVKRLKPLGVSLSAAPSTFLMPSTQPQPQSKTNFKSEASRAEH